MSKNLPWLRLYTEIIDDEKLLLLAFEDRWHYIALLACKGRGILDKDEDPQLMLRKVAKKLGVTTDVLDEVARRLAEVGLIERQTLQPLAWDERQFRSDADPTAAERKRRQREKEKNNVTGKSRVTGTDVTRTDTDTDADTDQEGDTPQKPPKVDPFEVALSYYPKRAGGYSRLKARKAWDARMKARVKPQDIIDGVKRYAAFIRATGKEGTEFVKMAQTFFGPDEHWQGDYEIPNDNQGGWQNGRNGASGGTRRESEAERVERVNREHDERERAAGASSGLF